MNYGETLAYWYLRLNGFIPLNNLVLHAPDEGVRYNSDVDILAVRFPHAFEVVGGNREDYDPRFAEWNLNIFDSLVCLVVEVKTGSYLKKSINQGFGTDRLSYAIARLGVLAPEESSVVADALTNGPPVVRGGITFAKLLVHDPNCVPSAESEEGLVMTPCLKLAIADAADFIRARMRFYREHKRVARLRFPGDLIQYLAWSEGLAQVVENEAG